MLRITVSKSAKAAIKYFNESLSKADYYTEQENTIGRWGGKAAEMLNLSGEVTKDHFEKLANNINPNNNEKLNVRDSENRRVGYDFTFSIPKSVSIAHYFTNDDDILKAHQAAKDSALAEIEKNMQTQAGQGKNKHYQNTGNIIHASFLHKEARPVDGVPDMHIHEHVFIFNSTFNKEKQRFQAGEFSQLHYDRAYYESFYNSHLAKNLQESGYKIERNNRDFELAGFTRPLIDKYSNRTTEVEKAAKELSITNSKGKSNLGARTRQDKNKALGKNEVRANLDARLTKAEKETIFNAKGNSSNDNNSISAKKALDHALLHHLERQSIVNEKQLLAEAIKRSHGSLTPDQIQQEYKSRKDKEIISKKDKRTSAITITTQFALDEESKLRDTARKGKNQFAPIDSNYQVKNTMLGKEQADGVKHFFKSKDFITIIAGGAGTGKTTAVKEIAEGLKKKGIKLGAFAPSTGASKGVQRDDGFTNATTIAELLINNKLQEQQKNNVIWLDEGGLIGNKDMNQILHIAKQQNARVLITGDIKQHNSVARGDSLRIIQQYGGIKAARISKIRRQKSDDYRNAVKLISDDKMIEGFNALDKMGAIKEASDFNELKANIAGEYLTAVKSKENPLIVATTHAQGKAVTDEIRQKMKAEKLLSKEKIIQVHRNLNLTDPEKQDAANYLDNMAIQFHKPAKGGFRKGSKYDVAGKDKNGNILIQDQYNKTSILPLKAADRFSVYEKENLAIAKGDKIRITQNGMALNNKSVSNGDMLSITGFTKEGNIMASTGKKKVVLDEKFRNLTHGYYTTSVASQGKSINRVIIAQGAASGKAASKEQFYVSSSRGKYAISIHTDDKEGLLKSIARSTQRETALDIAKSQNKAMQLTISAKNKFKKLGLLYRNAQSKVEVIKRKTINPISNLFAKPFKSTPNVSRIRIK